jgi:hypothetical protein
MLPHGDVGDRTRACDRVRSREILNRITGIDTPLGGVQWTPAVLDIDVARAVINFLEDRRVLYEEYAWEVPEHCVDSVTKIRQFLTDQISREGVGPGFENSLRAMRAGCRQFMSVMQRLERHGAGTAPYQGAFNQALGALRRDVGMQVAIIAVRFDIPVEEPLVWALPPDPRDDEDEYMRNPFERDQW